MWIGGRGFSIQEGDFPHFDRIIHQRGWTEFYKQPQATILPLVREFYANAFEHQGSVAQVPGKLVKFNCTTLKWYYSLQDIKYDEHSAYVSEHVNLTEVANTICRPNTQWNMSNGEAYSVKTSTLSKEAKTWHYFVGARFMPSSHLSDVIKDRAILIYYILMGKTIDIGSILHASILHNIRGGSMGLYFPFLIIAFCGRARVTWGPNKEVIQLVHAIDRRMMVIVKG